MITRGDEGYCLSKYWTMSNELDITTPVDWSWMNGTVYQGSLVSWCYIIAFAWITHEIVPPVGLNPGCLRTGFLRNLFDLVTFEPHSLIGQALVVECVTNWATYTIVDRGIMISCGR